jgi:chlorite dismutase
LRLVHLNTSYSYGIDDQDFVVPREGVARTVGSV